jgi:hypothetical protein
MGVGAQSNFPLPGGPEVTYGITRPNNLAVIWCIKAWNAPINQGQIDIAALAVQVQLLSVNGAVVGSTRTGRLYVPAASASATYTAEEVVLADGAGRKYTLAAFNQSINLQSAMKGIGAMDIGPAPVSGYVAIYGMYNPETKARGLMAVNTTTTFAPSLYGGANVPAGFTVSGLLTIVPTDGGGNFFICAVEDRNVTVGAKLIFSGAVTVVNAPIPLASGVPINAVKANGLIGVGSSGTGTVSLDVYSTSTGLGIVRNTATVSTAGGLYTQSFSHLPIITPQSWWLSASNAASGTPVFNVFVTSYQI